MHLVRVNHARKIAPFALITMRQRKQVFILSEQHSCQGRCAKQHLFVLGAVMPIIKGLKDVHAAQTQSVRNGSGHMLIKIEGKRH